ncbi:MAG: hypothetical protein HYS40_05750 [Gemmatimonadetes bacterium]|nr:hypothetical protein [Gemmatimonadota bacterium]
MLAACNTAVDAYKTFQPLAGVATSGGNPVLGTAWTLGGLGHLFVSARVNAVKAVLPNPDTGSASVEGAVPAPVIEAGVGLFRGMAGGLLSVDALGSATLLPTSLDKLSVESGATSVGDFALGIGYGLRVGVLNGAFPVPAVSVSAMRRTLPRIQYGQLGAAPGSGDAFEFDTDLKATNVRVTASWRFVLLDVAAGVGFDQYTSTAHLRYYNNPPTTLRDTVMTELDNSRQVLFANAGLNLAMLKLVGEIGYQTGKDQNLSTSYSDFDPKAGHVFGGVGVRLSF